MLSKSIQNSLISKMMHKSLVPGDKIIEAAIADEFKVSRTPVREALQSLSRQGLVTMAPGCIALVKDYTEREILEIGSLRLVLDRFAIRLAMQQASYLDYKALETIALKCLDGFRSNNHYERVKWDAEFHRKLSEISKHSLLLQFQTDVSLKLRFILTYYHTFDDNQKEEENLLLHLKIVEALQNRDCETALNTIQQHLENFYVQDAPH